MDDWATDRLRKLDETLIKFDQQFEEIKYDEGIISFRESQGLNIPRLMRSEYHTRCLLFGDEVGLEVQELRDLTEKWIHMFTTSEGQFLWRTRRELEALNEYPALKATRLPRDTGYDTGCVIM